MARVPDDIPPSTVPALIKGCAAPPSAVIARLLTPAGTVNVCRLPLAKVTVQVPLLQLGTVAAAAPPGSTLTAPANPSPPSNRVATTARRPARHLEVRDIMEV